MGGGKGWGRAAVSEEMPGLEDRGVACGDGVGWREEKRLDKEKGKMGEAEEREWVNGGEEGGGGGGVGGG